MRTETITTIAITSGTPETASSIAIPTNYQTRTVQVTSSGVTSANVTVWASNDGVGKISLNTFSLTSTANSDGFVLNIVPNWKYFGFTVNSATGTGSVTATATFGEQSLQ